MLTDYTQTLIHLIELAIGCVSPPLPPPDRNLVRIFEEGSIVDFGDKVTYVCLDGYHFHRSYKQTKYQVVCMKDGNFTKLDALEFCVHPKGKRMKYIHLYGISRNINVLGPHKRLIIHYYFYTRPDVRRPTSSGYQCRFV